MDGVDTFIISPEQRLALEFQRPFGNNSSQMHLNWKTVAVDGIPSGKNFDYYIVQTDAGNYYYVAEVNGKFVGSIYFNIIGNVTRWVKYDYHQNNVYSPDFKRVEDLTTAEHVVHGDFWVLIGSRDIVNIPYTAKYSDGSFTATFGKHGPPFLGIAWVAVIDENM